MLIDRNVTGKMLVILVIEKACTTVVRAMVKRDRAAVIKRFVTLQSVQGEDGFSVVEMTMEVKPVFGLKIENAIRMQITFLESACISASHRMKTAMSLDLFVCL